MLETDKRRRLRHSRLIALALLALTAMLLLVSGRLKTVYPQFAAVQFFAEAALIGGLADWFAVVALFRPPLGLPLPHTAIVPRNKDRIGHELGLFVEQNFLTPETIAPWLAKQDVVGHLLRWGSRPSNVRAVLRVLGETLAPVMGEAAAAGVPQIAAKAVSETLARVDVSRLIGSALLAVLASGADRLILDRALEAVGEWLDINRAKVKTRFGAHSPLTLSIVDSFVVNRFIDGIIDLIREVADDQQHEMRKDFATWLRSFAERLETDAALRERVTGIRRQLLARIDLDALAKDVWRTPRASESGFDGDRIARLIAQICRGVMRKRAIVAGFNERLSFAVASGVSGARLRLSTLVEGVVRAWDTRFMTEKLELEIGRDLQFIRLNGMLIGGLAGLVLHPLLLLAGID
jgi:uncharacterized membrane-anchored protein YjiN (DUF445 family)